MHCFGWNLRVCSEKWQKHVAAGAFEALVPSGADPVGEHATVVGEGSAWLTEADEVFERSESCCGLASLSFD